jgi:prepilin peptidase CpaA
VPVGRGEGAAPTEFKGTKMNWNEHILFLLVVLIVAVVSDIRGRKIPNWLTYSSMIVGLIYHTSTKGLAGLLFSIEGVFLGMGLLIIFYLMGGMGAGDAKLMGAVGGLLGPKGVFMAFLFTAIMGGIYALLLLTIHGFLKETAKRYGRIVKTFLFTHQFIPIPSPKTEKKPRLCYGVAIALGTLISLASGINIW